MKEQGCELDTLAYNTTIDEFCKLGEVNKTYQLLEEIRLKGQSPSVVLFCHKLKPWKISHYNLVHWTILLKI